MLILMMFIVLMSWGVITTMCSWSWWGAWLGMELTSFFFIPFLGKSKVGMLGFNLWEYFMIQSLGSGIYVLGMLLYPQSSFMLFSLNSLLYSLPMLGVLLKLGMPPFHWWSLLLVDMLSWEEFFLFSSLLKIPPIIVMMNLCLLNVLFVVVLLLMVVFVGVQGSVEVSVRRFVVYSSMINLVWVFTGSITNFKSSLWFMFFYMVLLALFCYNMYMSMTYTINSMYYSSLSISTYDRYIILFLLWSLMGFPPTVGFVYKLDILLSFWLYSKFLSLLLTVLGVILLPSYMNFMYSISLVSSTNVPSKLFSLHWLYYLLVLSVSVIFFWSL
uniref:NADH-ubiquinone oxidoreductase chain 2 n=1 Tax=Haematopinus quadripertusus TaxID=1453187 RepID=A0AAU7YT67_9NEOP